MADENIAKPAETAREFHTVTIDEGERQATLLSLAVLALVRPGWDTMLGAIADKLGGRQLFVDFKRFNRDRYVAPDRAGMVKPYCFAAVTILGEDGGELSLEFSMKRLLAMWEHSPEETYIVVQFQDTEETSSYGEQLHIDSKELSRPLIVDLGDGSGREWLKPDELERWEADWRLKLELEAELAGDGLTAADLVDPEAAK